MQNLYNDLEALLKSHAAFTVNNKLNKSRIADAAYKYDEKLIELLLSNKGLKKQFFQPAAGATIFKQREFLNFLSNKSFLKNSYTEFKNEIGLLDDKGEYLSENRNVMLAFPYKDCVLEGGQDKEEQKRDEIFYNETLAPDEITRLFDAKALTNFKLYNTDGEQQLTAATKIDFTNQNLILKGNNLLALHSLKKIKSIAGQVKLIYIDPPYNTGSDSFHYNDKFNHSTWLVFMKNRLEVAKELLKNDGAIFISIDENEIGYLLTLCDEVFGMENKANIISVKRGSVTGHKAINKGAINVTEYLLVYTKNKKLWKPNRILIERERNDRYNTFIENRNDELSKWKFISLLEAFSNHLNIPKAKLKKQLGETFDSEIFDFIVKNAKSVVQLAYPDKDKVSKEVLSIIEKSHQEPKKIFHIERNNEPDMFIIDGQRILFYHDRLIEVDGKLVTGEPLSDFWNDVLPNDLHNEGKVEFKKGKKPEKLLGRILELGSNTNDLVLDFQLGSGTTAAVSMKMNRRFIGIEQLDYKENGSIKRITNTIQGEQSGISKAVNWQGGGSFVYAELKRYNQFYIDEIGKAKDNETLRKLYEIMKEEEAFFRIDVDHNKWSNGNFEKLTLNEQKELLYESLDKNHLYVNLTEIEDVFYKMSEDDIALNKKFYNIS